MAKIDEPQHEYTPPEHIKMDPELKERKRVAMNLSIINEIENESKSQPKPKRKHKFSDIDPHYFRVYFDKCKKYWKQMERNELIEIHLRTFKHELPKSRAFLTKQQSTDLLNARRLHKLQMLENVRRTNFIMRNKDPKLKCVEFNKIETPEMQLKWIEFNIPDRIDTPCPCCKYEDYVNDNTTIV